MVAQAKGFFPAEDVRVVLTVELGWASIELKLASGQLCAANVPPSFPLLLSLKKSGFIQPMQALALTSYHGEAITLSRETAAALTAGKLAALKSVRIGVDTPHTLSQLFVQSWLKEIRQERNPAIQLVPLAISQLLDLMKDGYIQGFCCAEPIGQFAVEADIGVTVARSRDHPQLRIQSVLAATETFATAYPDAAKAIAAAVERGRLFCANPKNEAEIIRIYRKHLAQKPHAAALASRGASQPALATLIGFEPSGNGSAKDKDPFGFLATACASLPGVIVAEREIRDTLKRVFATLH